MVECSRQGPRTPKTRPIAASTAAMAPKTWTVLPAVGALKPLVDAPLLEEPAEEELSSGWALHERKCFFASTPGHTMAMMDLMTSMRSLWKVSPMINGATVKSAAILLELALDCNLPADGSLGSTRLCACGMQQH
jgi:hypothetical protein